MVSTHHGHILRLSTVLSLAASAVCFRGFLSGSASTNGSGFLMTLFMLRLAGQPERATKSPGATVDWQEPDPVNAARRPEPTYSPDRVGRLDVDMVG